MIYSKKVLDHFKNPRNVGKLKNPDGIGKVGNIVCGDVMYLYIKVEKNKIKDIKFETFGCTAAIATSSMITQMAKGKTLKQALDLGKKEVAKSLGGLPPVKLHCSLLASDALAEAIYNYLKKSKKDIPEDLLKKHQRILKEKQLIEEKYKDWTDVEKKLKNQN
jgi:nitrogen fixation NifU-like protein